MWNLEDLREHAVSLAETIEFEIMRLNKEVNLADGYNIEVGELSEQPYLNVGLSDINITFMQCDARVAETINTWITQVGPEDIAMLVTHLNHQIELALDELGMSFDNMTELVFTAIISGWDEKDTSFFIGMPVPVEWDMLEDVNVRENLKDALRMLSVSYLVVVEGINDYMLQIN